jgi:hypothetical protein
MSSISVSFSLPTCLPSIYLSIHPCTYLLTHLLLYHPSI